MEDVEKKWNLLEAQLQENFEEELTLKSILFLIGGLELGQGIRSFDKEERTNLLHIATCKLLSPFGYYKFINVDADGWPHYDSVKDLDELSSRSQELLMKNSIIHYFK